MENREVRVAMIGFGGIAKAHKRGYEDLERRGAPVKLVAICDINREQFTNAQAINIDGNPKYDLNGQTLYTDLTEMMEKESFEMVDICLPSYLHCEYTCKMLRAGKHILCEKPMALNSADCEKMISTAKECGKMLMIGQCLRFEPSYLFLRDAIEQGTFGRVKNAFFDRLSAMPRWGFEGWYHDTDRSGGAILDLHIHDVDMVRFLFGEPQAVSAISYDTETSWTVVNSRFLFGDDKIVLANASWDEAAGSKFVAPYRVRFEKASVRLEGGKVTVIPDEGEQYDAVLPRANRMAEEILALAESILSGTQNSANTPESAMMTVKLVEKLRESTAQRGAILDF